MTLEQNKVAIVTGGSRSLGRNTALHLAEAGTDIILTYQSNREAAEETMRQVEARGQRVAALPLDLSDTQNIAPFVADVAGQFKAWGQDGFDILVNNAGISGDQVFGDITEDAIDRLFTVNFKSTVLLTQALAPHLNDGGRIINMGTGLTRVTIPNMVVYATAKAALETFTRYLAVTLGSRQITVNTVAPGGIDNDFNAERFAAAPEVRDYIAGQTALGRVGLTEDIGPIVAFLASDAAHWVTGQRVEASGGFKL